MAKRVIFSDLHFGDPKCSLSNRAVASKLRDFLWGIGQVEEIILAGDILDANISTLTRAIEGQQSSGSWPIQVGFRHWLSYLFEDGNFDVGRIIYIPGNHDYIIWNILSTKKAFVDPISQGITPTNLPLIESTFPQPFIRGVAPGRVRDRFSVRYPDYQFQLNERSVLVTHGHYLDDSQSLFRTLGGLMRKDESKRAEAVKQFFEATAQYQAVANAVSYMKGSRDLVLKVYKGLASLFDVTGKLRGHTIDAKMLEAIQVYLHYFRQVEPDVFIFGHTHKAGHTNTAALQRKGLKRLTQKLIDFAFGREKAKRLIQRVIDVWNDGSFLNSPLAGKVGTFIVADDNPTTGGPIRLLAVDSKGNVRDIGL